MLGSKNVSVVHKNRDKVQRTGGLEKYSSSVTSLLNLIKCGKNREAHSQTSQTSKTDIFAKAVSSGKQPLVILSYIFQTLYLRCLAGF